MQFNEMLRELSRDLNLAEIPLDEFHVARIAINDEHVIHIKNSDEESILYMYALVCKLTKSSSKEELFADFLEANLFGKGTGKAAFALHKETGSILLTQTVEFETIDFGLFKAQFQDFINHVAHWKSKIKSYLEKEAEKGSGDLLQIMSQKNQKILFI
jgi:hypothetical protein